MPTVTHQTQSSYIHRFPDLKLSWSGDYESLKLFVDSELNLQGKWTSTGGENKLFESDQRPRKINNWGGTYSYIRVHRP